MRCYLAEHAMAWESAQVRISASGSAHCQGLRLASHKGFMLSSLGNPHIYVSPCALLHYARLLDYFDRLLSDGDVAQTSHENFSRSLDERKRPSNPVILAQPNEASAQLRKEERSTYLWAIDKLRKQLIALGETPDVALV